MLMRANSEECYGELSAVLIHADGSRQDYGIVSRDDFSRAFTMFKRMWKGLRHKLGTVAAILLILGLVHSGKMSPIAIPMLGLVTDAGLNFLAVAFTVDAVGTDIFNMKFHDSGTGITAAAQTDTALQTSAAMTRPSGTNTQTQSASGTGSTTPAIVQSVATQAFTASFAITEWGLFSALTSGTMWDHRIFAAINVVSGDSIQFTYSLSLPGGGT